MAKFFSISSMHRIKRSSIRATQSRAPLSQPKGSIYELHLCGRKSRADVVAERKLRPELFAVHQRSNGIRADIACGCEPHRTAEIADHPRANVVQIEHPRSGVRLDGDAVPNEHLGDAGIKR